MPFVHEPDRLLQRSLPPSIFLVCTLVPIRLLDHITCNYFSSSLGYPSAMQGTLELCLLSYWANACIVQRRPVDNLRTYRIPLDPASTKVEENPTLWL